MAITTLASYEDTMTVGKGSKKRDLVIMAYTHELESADLNAIAGNHLTTTYAVGSSTDTPFGLRPLSMELIFSTPAAYQSFSRSGAGMMTISGHEVTTNAQSGLITSGTMFEVLTNDSARHVFDETVTNVAASRVEFDPATTRMLTMPEIHLSASLWFPTGATIWVARRYVFEKVKLTKNEYMEKLIRNI